MIGADIDIPKDVLQIYLSAPINSGKYSFILQFADKDLYRTIRDEIYNNRDKIIIVAGEWGASGVYNSFVAEVISKKQIAIIKWLKIW